MRYSRLPLEDRINYFLAKGREGEFWDFKQEWHERIDELIKDIICFANTVHDEDCCLVFGVADDGTIPGMKKDRRKQADILDNLSQLMFAGDILPQISVETLDYNGVTLDVLVIYNTDKTPIYLKQKYGKMNQGCIYARVGDRNTPDNGNAEVEVIENLWRKRLGLTKPPLDYIFDALDNKLDWANNENGYYHIYKPEYTIEREEEEFDGRGSDEFYSYAQANESTSYYMLNIKAKGTTIDSYQIVCLDSGRLCVPVSEWGYIHFSHGTYDLIGYKYYVRGSHRELLMRFMYDPENGDQRYAFHNWEAVTLFFDSEAEKNAFQDYIEYEIGEVKQRIEASDEYDYIETGNELKTAGYKRSLRCALVLKEMLEEFRRANLGGEGAHKNNEL